MNVKCLLICVLLALHLAAGPRTASAQTSSALPPTIVPLSGRLTTPAGEPRTGPVLLTVSVYDAHGDIEPRWAEQQTVTLDSMGYYEVHVGATQADGIPLELFTSGTGVRWMGIAPEGEPEQPRMMLVSVPYASRAANAANAVMLAGKPSSDFVLTTALPEQIEQVIKQQAQTTDVTSNFLLKGASGVATDSAVSEVGGFVGIGVGSPSNILDILRSNGGNVHVRVTSDSSSGDPAFRFSTNATDWYAGVDNSDADKFMIGPHFTVGTDAKLTIDTSGNVGIGTSGPTQQLSFGRSEDGGNQIGTDTSDGADNKMLALSGGGAFLPARGASVRVYGNEFSTDPGSLKLFAGQNGIINFLTGGSSVERMRIAANGNIGIGTSAPGNALDVFRSDGSNVHVRLTSDSGAGDPAFRFSTNATDWYAGVSNSDADKFMIGSHFSVGTDARLVIDTSGNVGVGTTSPASKLHVVGAANVTGNLTAGGSISGAVVTAHYQDVAEWVEAVEPLAPGTVVAIDETGNNRVKAASGAYNASVAGAVSPQPGLILGLPGPGKVLVAQSGRVRVKADATNGAIKPGDLLVTSPKTGHAMRSKPVKVGGSLMHRPGTVLGKALEPLAEGTGEILVLLTLQ